MIGCLAHGLPDARVVRASALWLRVVSLGRRLLGLRLLECLARCLAGRAYIDVWFIANRFNHKKSPEKNGVFLRYGKCLLLNK